MVSLRAEENRYLVTAGNPREEALVRQVPGCRPIAAQQALAIQRQPGSVLALDRLFGSQGWDHNADLSQEVAEARSRLHGPAQQRAIASLVGNELSVECAFGDKELVKLVPGYRWSAPSRRWFLPASPMALDLLREHFGTLLEVEEAADSTIELKRREEQTAIERAEAVPVRPAAQAATPAAPAAVPDPTPAEANGPADLAPTDALLARLDRLTGAVEQLVEVLRGSGVVAVAPPPSGESETVPEANPTSQEATADWRDLLSQIENDAPGVRDQALRQAQTAGPDAEAPLRAVAGLAMARLGGYADALATLRRPLERPGLIDDDLAREGTLAYTASVLALVADECGPEGALASENDFRDRLLDELVNDNGFMDERIGSTDARSRLDYLVGDPVLRRIAPALSDYSRIAHLLGVARGGQWMAANRISDILREQSLGDEGFAFGLILLANALYDGKCVNEWNKAWPREDVADTLQDLSWLVTQAEARLGNPAMDAAISEPAALACLACIAGGPLEWASAKQRRTLVQLIALRNAERRAYAEFLAAFRPAEAGQKSILGSFPGWTKILAQTRLSRSAPYLMVVAANDNGGSGSLTWALAEDVYLQALELWGIDDPQAELVDLLDLLEGGSRPDNHLNQAGRLVEDSEVRWTERINREQRKALYRRALTASLDAGHNRDTIEAFDRLMRELRDEGATADDEILATCVRLSTAMRAVRGPALEVLLGMQLETGLPFEDTADQLVAARPDFDEAGFVLAGLFHLFPAFRAWWEEKKPAGVDLKNEAVAFPGKKVLIVGGHKWLENRVKPVLEDEWKVRLTWLDPDQVKNGDRGPENARGADLVVIGAACVGHSGAGRVEAAAKTAGVPILTHHFRAPAALLAALAQKLDPATA